MATPILFIGLGTSGLKILEQTQRFFYSTTGKNRPNNVRYLFVETHLEVDRDRTPEGTDIEPLFMSIHSAAKMVEELGDKEDGKVDLDWLPDPALMEYVDVGAGGMRCFGRLALWSLPPDGGERYFSQLHERIQTAVRELSHGNQNVAVYIVGSFAGGTASGMFLDVGYLTKFILDPTGKDSPNVYGIFLLPPSATNETRLLANSYGCLKDLDHYSRMSSQFSARWPVNNRPYSGFARGVSPFKLTTFLSMQWATGEFASIAHLYKITGLFLFKSALGFHDYRGGRLVDALNESDDALKFTKYSFFNLSALSFPKLEIEEYLAAEKSQELLRKLIDRDHCFGLAINGDINDQSNRRLHNYTESVDDFLEKAFVELGKAGANNNLEDDLRDAADEISQGNVEGSLFNYLRSLLNSNGPIYSAMENRIGFAVDAIVRGAREQFVEALDDSENLEYALVVLGSIQECFREVLAFWDEQGIQDWDNRLPGFLDDAVSQQGRIYGERRNLLLDRMKGIVDLMKMHTLYASLHQIDTHIESGTIQELGGSSLPTKPWVREIIESIVDVISRGDESSRAPAGFESLEKRKSILETRGETPPQLKEFFPNGSFKEEIRRAREKFVERPEKGKSLSKTILGYPGSLWEFLSGDPSEFHVKLQGHCMDGLWKMISHPDQNCVHDLDVSDFIRNHPNMLTELAQSATAESLSLGRQIRNAKAHPKVIVTGAGAIQSEALEALHRNDFKGFDNTKKHGGTTFEELQNMIIFFDERGAFKPLEDLANINAWQEYYEAERKRKGTVDAYHYEEEEKEA